MNKNQLIYILVGIVVLGGIFFVFQSAERNNSSIPGSNSQTTGEIKDFTSKNEVNLEISNYKFVPATIRIKKGTKVTWTNKDIAQHNVAADDGSFKTELVGKNGSVEVTFDNVGTFSYFCEPHPYMKGTVIVEDDSGQDSTESSAKTFDLVANQKATLFFSANLSGRFPFELEQSQIELGALEVQPQ